MFFRQRTQSIQIALLRQHEPHIACNRLNDDGSDFIAHLIHDPRNRLCIVVRHGNRVLCHTGRNSGAVRHAKGCQT